MAIGTASILGHDVDDEHSHVPRQPLRDPR
jgi:hypothetical protein